MIVLSQHELKLKHRNARASEVLETLTLSMSIHCSLAATKARQIDDEDPAENAGEGDDSPESDQIFIYWQ